MEKLNLNFTGGENILKSILWIMSYLSWLMLVATGWASLKWLDDEIYHIIWTISAPRTQYGYDPLKNAYYPFQMHVSLIYIVFILTLIIILGGCVVFFVKTIVKKDDQVINGMMGQFSRYHFFPLLCASALFIIGECYDQNVTDNNHFKNMYVCGLVFSLLGLASMIFIYIMTDLNTNDWWVLLLLKKGTYSCLIVLMWYYFCYDIYYVHDLVKPNEDQKKKDDWKKGCGIAFSIIFGIGSLAFSFVFKDLVAGCMNLLIYIGLTVGYFKLDKNIRKLKDANKNGDGAIDVIMIVLSAALVVLLVFKYREECLKS
jgi:hypothetical protein